MMVKYSLSERKVILKRHVFLIKNMLEKLSHEGDEEEWALLSDFFNRQNR